jgi:predicted dehydrogenase
MSEQTSTTRRDFIKTTAAIAAAGAAISPLVRPPAVYAAGSAEIKVGLIGCGGRGTGAAGQNLSTQGPVKLVAVADAFEDKCQQTIKSLKGAHGERVDVKKENVYVGFDAYKGLIDSGIDLVVIATSPGFRPIHFEYAVQKGLNVFMEKPVGTDAPGIRRLLAANEEAKKKDLKVSVGLQRHHQAKYIETMKRLHDGAIGGVDNGEIDLIRVYWNGNTPWVRQRATLNANKMKESGKPLTEIEYQMRNWYFFVWLCGDHITEQHIHNLDVANWLKKGPPVKAQGMGGRQIRTGIDHGQIYDHHAVEFTYADGTTMMSQCRHMDHCKNDVSEHAAGIKGMADMSSGYIKTRDGQEWRYKEAPKHQEPNPYQVEHDDLMDAIRNNKPHNEAEYGAMSTMTSILGRMATYSGQEVTMKQALASNLDLHPKIYDFDATPETAWPDEEVRCAPNQEGRYWIPTPGLEITRANVKGCFKWAF